MNVPSCSASRARLTPVRGPNAGGAARVSGLVAALAALALLAGLAPVSAAVVASPERVVNTSGQTPAIALDAEGRAVIAWRTTDGRAIRAGRFLADQPQGASFTVNSITRRDLSTPRVALDADGDFIVVWATQTPTAEARASIRGQLFGADAVPRGRELALSTPSVRASSPVVAMAPDGRFIVGYDQANPDPGQTVRIATFDAAGERLAGPVVFPGRGTLANLVGGVTASDDTVAAALTEYTPCPSNPLDPISVVWTLGWTLDPVGEADRLANDNPCIDGPIVKALLPTDIGPFGVFEGRRYSIAFFSPADGKRLAPRVNVAEFPTHCWRCEQVETVAADASGRFVLVWERVRHTNRGARHDLFGQVYSREGDPVGGRFQISDKSSNMAQFPSAALAADGTLLVVWQRNGRTVVLRKLDIDS